MFRKIVSNLAFSPALVGQLGFYAKRLRKEEATRRIGLIFTALALVVQSFAVFSPPESANAASDRDFIRGGISSISQYLGYYDRNANNLRDMMNYIGVTRAEIVKAKKTTINSKDGWLSWGRTSPFSAAQGDVKHTYSKSNGGTGVMHSKPLRLWDSLSYTKKHGSTYTAWVGYSAKIGTFAIMHDCANAATKRLPPPPPKPVSSCTNLSATKISRTEFDLNAKASAKNGAKIKSYVFKVKNGSGRIVATKTVSTSSASSKYRYIQNSPGTYTATLTVNTSTGVKGGAACQARFTVSPPPAIPAAACTALKSIISNRTIVRLTGEASVSGGAKVSKYTFTVKDGSGKTIATRIVSSDKLSVDAENIVITTPGDYTAALEVSTSVGARTSEQNCVGKFTIVKPAVCALNPSLPENSPECQPCPGDSSIWIKDQECVAELVQTKSASNLTRGNVEASTLVAKASDRISYTINIENRGLQNATSTIQEDLQDVLEYATVIDTGGAKYSKESKTLTWPSVTLKPNAKQSRVFVVQLNKEIPAVANGKSDRTSYDCIMTNTFGNTVNINVNCPAPKQIEQVVSELPKTGATENMLFAGMVLAVVTYFYARARQVKKEVRLIRRDLNAGTI